MPCTLQLGAGYSIPQWSFRWIVIIGGIVLAEILAADPILREWKREKTCEFHFVHSGCVQDGRDIRPGGSRPYASSSFGRFEGPEDLHQFAIDASFPFLGINLVSLHGAPEFSAFHVLSLLDRCPEVMRCLELNATQIDATKEISDYVHQPERFALEDESEKLDKVFSVLTPSQRHRLELIGLRTDGCVVLLRKYFAEALSLEPQVLLRLQDKVREIRRTRVAERFQATFSNPDEGSRRILSWEATKDVIEINFWVYSCLSEEQLVTLSKLIDESSSVEAAAREFQNEVCGVAR